jgi:SpoIID/LytB domain protein
MISRNVPPQGKLFLGLIFTVFFISSPSPCPALQPAAKVKAEAAETPAPSATEALRLYYEGDLEKSILAFEKILVVEPKNTSARRQLVRLYRELGDYDRVVRLLGELWLLNGGGPTEDYAAAERDIFIALCLAGKTDRAAMILPLSEDTGETLFYQAVLLRDRGEPENAAELFKKSLALGERRPMAWLFLGELLAQKSPAEAEEAFRTALRLDASLTAAVFSLAEAVLARGRHAEAYTLFQRARNIAPDHPGPAARIVELETRFPDLVQKKTESAVKKKETAAPPRVVPLFEADTVPIVRVGLAEGLKSVSLKAGGDYILRYSADGASRELSGKKHDILTVRWVSSEISLLDKAEKVLLTSPEPVVLEYIDPADTTIVFDLVSEAGSFFAVTEDRAYRGGMEFRPGEKGTTLVNSINIEEYLYGVLPSEMPASWPKEALRTQAIAARSYTLAYLGTHREKGFDLYGSVLSAAYGGVGAESRPTTEAVNETRGLYLHAGGKPLRAYYSANHGGYSEDSLFVWGSDAHMQAVPDKLLPLRETYLPLDELDRWLRVPPGSYSAKESYHFPIAYRWEKWVPAADLAARISRDAEVGEVLMLLTRGRGISGRVREVEILGTKGSAVVRGDRIRSRLGGLRSNLFTVTPKLGPSGLPEYFIFRGAGWGHGVGLDQSGAAGMAASGFTAEEILRHYYPKAELGRY